MASVTADWVERRLLTSRYNPTITFQGRDYHSIGAFVPPRGLWLTHLSVYIHETDSPQQFRVRAQNCDHNLSQSVLNALAAMMQQHNSYVQTLMTLGDWAFAENRPGDYTMMIHADKRPAAEHVRRYNGPTMSEVAAITLETEKGEVAGRDIILRRRDVL